MLDNISNQPDKLRTKSWVELNEDSRGNYNTNSQIKFKTLLLKSSLCEYSDAYILAKRTISVKNTAAAGNAANDNDN